MDINRELKGLKHYVLFSGNATMDAIKSAREEIADIKVGLVIGVGGGSKIDMGNR